MSWTRHLENPKSLTSMFESVEGLDALEFHSVELDREGPIIKLRADLPRFPDVPPPRWVSAQANCVQVILTFWGVSNVQLSGWATRVDGRLSVVEEDGGLSVKIEAPPLVSTFRASQIHLDQFTPYLRSDRP